MIQKRYAINTDLFLTFFRIGLFTFGGGYAMLPLIEKTIINQKKWINEQELMDILAVAQTMPGPIAVNAAALIGKKLRGNSGAVSALIGCALPSILIILILATVMTSVQDNPYVTHAFMGIRAAVTALIVVAAVKMGRRSIRDRLSLILVLITIVLVFFLQIHPLFLIAGGSLLGFSLYFIYPAMHERVVNDIKDAEAKKQQQRKEES